MRWQNALSIRAVEQFVDNPDQVSDKDQSLAGACPIPYVIKSLEWSDPGTATNHCWTGVSPLHWETRFGWQGYSISLEDGRYHLHVDDGRPGDLQDLGDFSSLDEAKSAAECDYRLRLIKAFSFADQWDSDPDQQEQSISNAEQNFLNQQQSLDFLLRLHDRFSVLVADQNPSWLPSYAKGESWDRLARDVLSVASQFEKQTRTIANLKAEVARLRKESQEKHFPEGTLSMHGNDVTIAYATREEAETAFSALEVRLSVSSGDEAID